MWSEIDRYAPRFASAVLTTLADDGTPTSVRCRVEVDKSAGFFHCEPLLTGEVGAGPACLLFHKHDERLWGLLSFVLRGEVVDTAAPWAFRPQQFVPGVGIGGVRSYVNFLVNGRRTTRRYLAKRGWPRPRLDWRAWSALMRDVRQGAIQYDEF